VDMAERPRRVVVGVDESEHAAQAARWAADEAAERGYELALVYAQNFPHQSALASAIPFEDVRDRARRHGEELLEKVRGPLASAHPDLVITTETTELGAAESLVELSEQARLVVTGSRGHGGFTGLALGSVSQKVASHAHCPVVIVRD
jgi:nucleotide-binding universal stress UspA family protein